jgi:aldose 1-epimerase
VPSTLTEAPFGRLPDGAAVRLFTLTNARGMVVKVSEFGAIITSVLVPDRAGALADVVHGFDELAPYLGPCEYFGAVIGRYGNRIANGRFVLDGAPVQLDVNNGPNHLHGGELGFHRRLWRGEPDADGGLTLHYRSPAGEQGYPGTLDVTVRYSLSDDADELLVQYRASTDAATPVNLTQHSYFNLAGTGDILAHTLQIDAAAYLPVAPGAIPTGTLAPVDGTPFDFRAPRPIGERIDTADAQLREGGGYDHHYVLDKPAGAFARAARVRDPSSGRVLDLFTDQPGVQFYSGNFLDGSLAGKGRPYTWRSGLCLEPQHAPDSPNRPAWPDTIVRPGAPYASDSRYRFSVEA